ncbi:hypothetical protein [uncultured Ruminococcus sp.]|uniref:hypothetical protein n=1 Tax=uncultured Ruminococcus sp. TaxID=165186 RepID=UPI0026034D1A|nr:hypothetical protein [uncultured Ruminococcus sp.]
MDAWDIFCLTGHVDDYLHYRQAQGLAQPHADPATTKEKKPHGNIPRTGAGTADSGRPWEVH